MNRVDDRLEQRKALRRQADTSADYNTGIVCGSQVTLHSLRSRFIRTDEAEIALPSPIGHLLQRKRNTGAYWPRTRCSLIRYALGRQLALSRTLGGGYVRRRNFISQYSPVRYLAGNLAGAALLLGAPPSSGCRLRKCE
jgi:hypothetical protein